MHSKLSASGSSRWMNCPASVKAEEGFPDVSNEYAEEGTAAHHLAAICLKEHNAAMKYKDWYIHVFEDHCEFNESEEQPDFCLSVWEVNDEMVENVQEYLDFCNALPGVSEYIEKKVNFDNWVPGGFGTADYIKVDSITDKSNPRGYYNHIHLPDFKYGKGVRVSAEMNSQQLLYALGVTNEYGFLHNFEPEDVLSITIVQPRLNHIDTFKMHLIELNEWAHKILKPAVEAALSDNPEYNPGEIQCRFCKAKATCPALANYSLQMASDNYSVIEKPFDIIDKIERIGEERLSNAQIGILMGKIETLAHFIKAVEAYAFDELSEGRQIPGFKLVEGRKGNRKWKDEWMVWKQLKHNKVKKDDAYKPEVLKTPAQIEKILKAKRIDTTEFEYLWESPPGKPTITKESDKRPAIEPASVFDVIKP